MNIQNLLCLLCASVSIVHAFPDVGQWEFNISSGNTFPLFKSLYKGSQVFVRINCDAKSADATVRTDLVILQSNCWNVNDAEITHQTQNEFSTEGQVLKSLMKVYQNNEVHACDDHIFLKEAELNKEKSLHGTEQPVYVVQHDGVYILDLKINTTIPHYSIVHIEMLSDYGYLSAADWPLLQFYGFMCIYYVILGVIWLILSFLQWRDLLRVQFWIGGVILLGMLEKATFYAEYQNVNSTGIPVQGAILFAEWVSCAKRTLARMLVVIVSLGFGIVKPRLGATLHRVVGVGLLYFFLAASEGYLRVTRVNSEIGNRDLLVASVPLAVLDSAICWWIFSALVNTTRTLRLRRNETKLNLYRHFTNTLIFSVVASVFFMLYCIKTHHFVTCLKAWKEIWLEEAYWHILFSCLLLVIMILWRPTNNNQRYAFVPLLDTGDDAEEEEQLVNDAYGVKVRIHHSKPSVSPRSSVDDDLKWLEEHIKGDPALPILDSDEELVNTRFEVSKMQ